MPPHLRLRPLCDAAGDEPLDNNGRTSALQTHRPPKVDTTNPAPSSKLRSCPTASTRSDSDSDLSSIPGNLSPIKSLRYGNKRRPPNGTVMEELSRGPSLRLEQTDLDKHFHLGKCLGQGRYGLVRQVKSKGSGKHFALKTVMSTFEGQVEVELAAGFEFDHPYVVKLHAFFREGDFYHLVMDLCCGGDLMSLVQNYAEEMLKEDPEYESGLPSDVVARYTYQMLHGLTFLHHHGFIHRDIKPENYLLEHNGPHAKLKLADFGCACRVGREAKVTRQVGTPFYMAPELLEKSYDQKVDVWSVGVTCFAMCTNGLPFQGDDKDYMNNVRQRKLIDYEPAWVPHADLPALRKVIMVMMAWAPQDRPTAKMLLSDNEWLKPYGAPAFEADTTLGAKACCTIS